MRLPRLTLRPLGGAFAVCRLDPHAAVPPWVTGGGPFSSVTRTDDELSVVCPEERVPPGVRAERGWLCLQVEGPLNFSLTGVLASLSLPLAEAALSIFAISTFDTDYLLVRESHREQALAALASSGHVVRGEGDSAAPRT